MSACNNASKTAALTTSSPKVVDSVPPQEKPQETPQMVGGDRDEHNCIGSAGYQWSEVRKECLRLFEKGIRLNPVDASLNQTVSAFIIFSDDKSKAELFLPTSNKSTLLLQNASDKNIWELDDYRLKAANEGFILESKGKVLYKK